MLAVVPTAGIDVERLSRCLDALQASSHGVEIRPVLVVCPATPEIVATVRRREGHRATVIALPPPFNYPRSINVGLAQREPEERCALLLNDDCRFTGPDDLHQLATTLTERRWA